MYEFCILVSAYFFLAVYFLRTHAKCFKMYLQQMFLYLRKVFNTARDQATPDGVIRNRVSGSAVALEP